MPGQPGTKKWLRRYGDRLVCVRYKYDAQRKRKFKTIELIVDEAPWSAEHKRIPKNKIVGVRVEYGEITLGRIVRAAGGRWNRRKKVWELPYGDVKALGLTHRIVSDDGKNV